MQFIILAAFFLDAYAFSTEGIIGFAIGKRNKKSFFYALQTCFIKRPEDMKIFAQAFSLFWQNPRFRDRMRDLLLPQTRIQNPEEEKEELAKIKSARLNIRVLTLIFLSNFFILSP